MAEDTAKTEEEKAAQKLMQETFNDIVQSSLDQFSPGKSAYDQMLEDQGFGIYGPPVDYNMPGGSRGSGYDLLYGQPYANYNPNLFATPSGIGSSYIPDLTNIGRVVPDSEAKRDDYSFSGIPSSVLNSYISNYGLDLPSYDPNQFLNRTSRTGEGSSERGGFREGIRNLFNPDKTIRGRDLQYGRDYNVRDRVFKNPEFENLLGNVLSATSGLGAVPVFGDALSKVTGGGVGLLLKALEKVPGIGGPIERLGNILDDRSKGISKLIGQGATDPVSMVKGATEYFADKVAPNRPGFLLQKVAEDGTRTHGVKTLLNRIADTVAENRPNLLLREYDEKTGKLTGNNAIRQAISAIQDRMPRNVRASMERATNIDPNLLSRLDNVFEPLSQESLAQAIANETNQFSDTDVETAAFLRNALNNLDSNNSSQNQVDRGYTGNLMNINPDAGYGGLDYSGVLLGSSPFSSTYTPSIGDDIVTGRFDSSTRNSPNYTGTVESGDFNLGGAFDAPSYFDDEGFNTSSLSDQLNRAVKYTQRGGGGGGGSASSGGGSVGGSFTGGGGGAKKTDPVDAGGYRGGMAVRDGGLSRLASFANDPSGLNTDLMGGRSLNPFSGGNFLGNERFGGLTPKFNNAIFDMIGRAVQIANDPVGSAYKEAASRGMTVQELAELLRNQQDMADGGAMYPRKNGQISGPGTEKSDDIPAMLSDGEFVTNAAALRGIGRMAGAPANDKAEQRRLGAKEMYKLQRKGMKAAGVA